AVLPHDGAVLLRTAPAVPEQRGLALVGDANGRDFFADHPRLAHRLTHRAAHALPDLLGVVLDPTGFGEVLGELTVGPPQGGPVQIHHQRGGAGGALVDR